MKFTTSSVLLDGGCRVKLDVYIPSFLLDYEISDVVWQKAIDDFNKKLDSRSHVTTRVNGINIDVLKVESVETSADFLAMGAVILLIVAKEEDVPKIADIHFCLTGYLTFDGKSGKVDGMVINNITYGGADSKTFRILDDSYEQRRQVSS